MPAELDVSKILLLSVNARGAPKIEGLNLDFNSKTA